MKLKSDEKLEPDEGGGPSGRGGLTVVIRDDRRRNVQGKSQS